MCWEHKTLPTFVLNQSKKYGKGNPKFSRDVKSLDRQLGGPGNYTQGGGAGTIGPHGTAVGTGGGYYGKGNKARRRAGLNVKEREYPTKVQKSIEDNLGFKALSKKESIARSQRRKAGTPTMKDLQTKTFPQKGLSIDKAFDKFKGQVTKKLVDEPTKKLKTRPKGQPRIYDSCPICPTTKSTPC